MLIIANPASRGSRGKKLIRLITRILDEKGISYTVSYTNEVLHATRLAHDAADAGEKMVLCVGGDGTVSEIAGGLIYTGVVLGIIPAGTGNDFAKSLNIPRNPIKALDIALSGMISEIDACKANGRVFINAAGSGLDVAALNHTLKYKKFFHGLIAYILGVLRAVALYKPMDITIKHEGGELRQKALLVSVANGRYIGGGMCVAPLASVDDGLLDVQYVDPVARFKIPVLLAGFIRGIYLNWPIAHHFRCKGLTVTTSDGSLQLDGEILTANEINYEILPKAMRITTGR